MRKNLISTTLINFYQDLFTTSSLAFDASSLDLIHHIVSEDMNAQLSEKFMAWEVAVAIKEMALLKASGSDGMPPLFYQKY